MPGANGKVRVQLELSPKLAGRLKDAQRKAGHSSQAETIRFSLNFFLMLVEKDIKEVVIVLPNDGKQEKYLLLY